MRTTIDIDPALIREAMAATGQSTPEAAIEEALRQVVQVARQRGAGEELAGPNRELIRAQSKAVADYVATNPEAAEF